MPATTLRRPFAVLLLVCSAMGLRHLGDAGLGVDWHYFAQGARLLFGRQGLCSWDEIHQMWKICPRAGGLHLYANYPDLQIGPLALLASVPFLLLPGLLVQEIAVGAALMLLGFWLLLRLITSTGTRESPPSALNLALGAAGLYAWAAVALDYAHVDDALVLAVGILLTEHVCRRIVPSWPLLGAGLGTALAAKPTALALVPLLLCLPGRDRWRAAALAGLLSAVAWGPFVVVAPHTVTAAGGFLIHPTVNSPMTLLGWSAVAPPGTRALQALLALALGALLVTRGMPGAVLSGTFAVRVLLDPGDFTYHSASVVLGCVVLDVVGWPHRTAVARATRGAATLVSLLLFLPAGWFGWSGGPALVRLLACVFVLAAVLTGVRPSAGPDEGCQADEHRLPTKRVHNSRVRNGTPAARRVRKAREPMRLAQLPRPALPSTEA